MNKIALLQTILALTIPFSTAAMQQKQAKRPTLAQEIENQKNDPSYYKKAVAAIDEEYAKPAPLKKIHKIVPDICIAIEQWKLRQIRHNLKAQEQEYIRAIFKDSGMNTDQVEKNLQYVAA